jgi:hypothetical protein
MTTMFCPRCGSEYREGFTACPDCEVALVDAPPPDEHAGPDEEWVTVLETGDPGHLALAHSLLDAEGLTARFPGEGLQSLFGFGSLGAGFNIVVGPAAIQVPAHEAEQARELLAGLEQSNEPVPDEDEDEDEEEDDDGGEEDSLA